MENTRLHTIENQGFMGSLSDAGKGAGNRVAVDVVALRHVFRRGADELVVVEDLTFSIQRGRFASLVGPSGCGKSTVLRLISGLLPLSGGEVFVNGEPVRRLRTDIGYMFQSDALIPWRTVLENVSLPLKFAGVDKRSREARAREWIATVGLTGFETCYPHQLSGGMRKRVSLACTLVSNPDIILMDEPFSALDVQTRNLMESELMAIWARDKKTVLFVTHDIEEAISLSDEVVVMTARPSRVKSVHEIDLPRPRNILEIRTDRCFHTIYTTLWNDMRDEVMSGYREAGL